MARQARVIGYPEGVSLRPAELLRLRLRCDASAPAQARRAIAELTAIDAVRDDAVLIVSELATNAVVHSGSEPEEELELRADLVGAGVRLAVIDAGHSKKTPVRRNGHPIGPGGMGLRVVESLARRWGSKRNRRLEVWAELAL